MKRVGLVIGANGVVGSSLIKHLHFQPEWEYQAISKRDSLIKNDSKIIKCDLLNKDNCENIYPKIRLWDELLRCGIKSLSISNLHKKNLKMTFTWNEHDVH